tara:strand:+ start:15449 stop:16651 length:1203 start_codon:yes stop_codon:yes gene_type:complete
MSVLEGKNILLGVTGSIAAYKSIILLRLLKRAGANVQIIFSDSANNFVTQLTFSTLSEKKVLTDFFEDDDKVEWVNHVELAEWADYMIIAPITSSTLSKLVTGNADNLLVATYMSTVCDVFFAPAMDLEMYNSESTKINIKSLVERGNIFIKPAKGYLASGLNGDGRLEEPENIFKILVDHISDKLIYNKKNILVTAGPTYERIDPVRFISNHSSGKMGHEIAKEAAELGANVVLVTGPTQISLRNNSIKVVNVTSADEMYEKCLSELKKMDYLIMAAAVSDFKPKKISKTKIKKNIKKTFNLELVKNIDIISELSKLKKNNQKVIGFALETENEIANAKIKLEKKQLDAIVLNSMSDENTCFNSEKNKIHFITNSKTKKFKLKFKNEVAKDILYEIYNL